MVLDLTTFLGHLHPLVVHLPIGFLLLAVVFEFLSYLKKFEELKHALSFTLLLGFLAAAVASGCGYLLSLGGNYDPLTLSNHKLAGILLTIVSGVLYLLTINPFKRWLSVNRPLFSGLSLGLFLLVNYTGHLGGTLTHGADYLSFNLIGAAAIQKPVTVGEALLFEDLIQPMLDKRCAQCHREGKMKGNFSVHTLADLIKGGKSGSAVVGGALEKSELYNRITLDSSNEKHMPADGKTPLTADEIRIIKWWIEKGMALKGKKISELKDAEPIKPLVAKALGLGVEINNASDIPTSENRINPDIPEGVTTGLLDSMRNHGLSVRIMLHKPLILDITLPSGSGNRLNEVKPFLRQVAKNVVWLNLSQNGLTENELDFLPLMTNLEKLRLEKNPITDAIVGQLEGLTHLEALNLNETKITKSCLERLKQVPNLKRVYSWHTVDK
jgi:uncharacterized membrane protein